MLLQPFQQGFDGSASFLHECFVFVLDGTGDCKCDHPSGDAGDTFLRLFFVGHGWLFHLWWIPLDPSLGVFFVQFHHVAMFLLFLLLSHLSIRAFHVHFHVQMHVEMALGGVDAFHCVNRSCSSKRKLARKPNPRIPARWGGAAAPHDGTVAPRVGWRKGRGGEQLHPEEREKGEMGSPEKIGGRIEGRERGRDPIGLDPIHRSKSHPDRRPGWRNSGVHAQTMNTSILMHACQEPTMHDQHHP